MEGRKISVEEQQQLIPDDEIHAAFLRRDDIAQLSPDEQERRWQEALPKIRKFQGFLATCQGFVLPDSQTDAAP